MRIGIETELTSYDYNQYDIADMSWLKFNTFKPMTSEIGVKMSEEYYNTTIEYNFTPFELNEWKIWDVKKYLTDQINTHSLSLNSEAPSFVGTHIHIFDSPMISLNKPRLLRRVMSYILDNLDWLAYDSKMRLMSWHQLWAYWSHKNSHKWVSAINKYWIMASYYESNSNKRKYAPIISSPASPTWKEKSLEIRLIPNEFLFNGKLFELLKEIENWEIYKRRPVQVDKFVETICKSLWMEEREEERFSYCWPEITMEDFRSLAGTRPYDYYNDMDYLHFDDIDFSLSFYEIINKILPHKRRAFLREIIEIISSIDEPSDDMVSFYNKWTAFLYTNEPS